uniref:Odorant receptor n=1 Tax=Dendroctonus ponderosae TaxID=77166 RepID=A0AAR5QE19_DENPD
MVSNGRFLTIFPKPDCLQLLPDNQLFQIPMYLSVLVGIWPIILTESKWLKKAYRLFATMLYYYYLEYICRAYFQLVLLVRAEHLNLEEILGNLCITLIYTVSMIRLRAFDTQQIKTLFSTIVDAETLILQDPDPEVRKIYLAVVRRNKVSHFVFFICGWMVSFLYFLHPFFMELPTMKVNNETITLKTLPLSTWWPIDVQKHYWTAYCWNVFDGTLGSSFVIDSDMLAFSLVVFAVCRLDILSYRLQRLQLAGGQTSQQVNWENFRNLIVQHQEIIAYVDTFNDGMKYVMLFDFLQCSVQLATITLQLLVMKINFQNVLFVGVFLITMVMRLVIYYFNGNEIIYKSQQLAIDIWMTDWYKQSHNVKHMILFFSIRAQRPLKFLIGPFGVLSLETFITIIKATYSYMMLFVNTSK